MLHNNSAITATFIIYICLMFAIGLLAFKKTTDLSDYILGGRRLGSLVTALSAGASDMSGWLLLGLPGFAYVAGLEAIWIALGLAAGTYLNWRFVAARLRAYTEIAGNSLTIPAFLEHRFSDQTRLLRLISAFFILLFFLFYTSAGLVAGGKLFNLVFELPYHQAVIAGAATIVVYTFFGGFLAVSWTDVLQGILMLLALLIVPVMAMSELGGWDATSLLVEQKNPMLNDMFLSAAGEPLGLIAIMSLLGWGLGYFGQPHILARFMAIRSLRQIPLSRRIAMSWVIFSLTGALLAGFTGIAYLDQLLAGPATETVFMLLATALLNPVIAGICLAAILAAIMSTADSQLLVSASTFTGDLYKFLVRKDASEQELVWTGRTAVLIIAIAATALAWNPDAKVLDLVAYAWAGFGASFGPVILLSLYWRRMTHAGVIAGILTGGSTVVIWKQLSGGIFDLYEIIPGMLLSCLAIYFVSFTTSVPGSRIQKDFDLTKATLEKDSG